MDFTSGGLRDMMVYEVGLYTQRLSYGLGLIAVDTTADPTAETSVQQIIATEYNEKVYAHQDRLGGNSYFTDPDGALVTYNEFDAWGNSITLQPDDANYSGLNLLTGFTGYTYDAVLGLYFAQARLYDAQNKRFTAPDPVGGSITNPQSLNPYVYCVNSPQNHTDPTGMWIATDAKLSSEKQAAIKAATNDYYTAQAKGDKIGMALAHETAVVIRNMTSSQVKATAGAAQAGNASSYYAYAYGAIPPTATDILVAAIHQVRPALAIGQVVKTAKAWVALPNVPKPKPPVAPAPQVSQYQKKPLIAQVPTPTPAQTDPKPDAVTGASPSLSLNNIIGAGASVADERSISKSSVDYGLFTVTTGRKETTTLSTAGNQTAVVSASVNAKGRTDDALRSSVGANLSVAPVSLGATIGLDNIGINSSYKNGDITGNTSLRFDLADLKVGWEVSATTKINNNVQVTEYTNYSINAKSVVAFARYAAWNAISTLSGGSPGIPILAFG